MARPIEISKKEIIFDIKKLSKELGRKPSKRDSSRLNDLAKRHFGSWNNALEEAGFDIKILQKPNVPTKLDENLSYFLGLLITDGHIVINNYYKIMIYTSYAEEKLVLKKLIGNLFDYTPSVRGRVTGFSNNINYEIYISSKILAEILVKDFHIPSGAKSKVVIIPKYFFNSSNRNILAFIRGVIDGDGYVAKDFLRFASGSENFLKDLRRLLNLLNIKTGKISKDKRTDTFTLCVYRKADLQRLAKFLYWDNCPFYPRKKISWQRYLN